MPQTLASLVGVILILLVCGATVLVGGVRARRAAAVTAAGVLASVAAQRLASTWDPVLPLSVIDAMVLVALIVLAWRPRRRWPIWAVGFQGVTVAIDILRLADARIPPYTYLTAVALSTYGLTAVIAYAGWATRRDRRA